MRHMPVSQQPRQLLPVCFSACETVNPSALLRVAEEKKRKGGDKRGIHDPVLLIVGTPSVLLPLYSCYMTVAPGDLL